jgi:outer membrane immunogenic protein
VSGIKRNSAKVVFFVAGSLFVSAAASGTALAAPPTPMHSWTGFYVGANVGYGWGNTMTDLVGYPPPIWAMFLTAPGVPASYDRNLRGFIGGGQAGYNYQTGNFVYGLEADFSFSDIHHDLTRTGFDGVPNFFADTESQKLKWLATLRGRFGVAAMENLLIYVTGGLAVGSIAVSTDFSYPGSINTYVGSATKTKAGWTIGGGAEYALSQNWSIKLEYLYVDLGTTSAIGIPNPPNPPLYTEATVDTKVSIARVGVNYRFGGP